MRTVHAFSAGGVVVTRDRQHVALIRVRQGDKDRWVLPKGNVEKGEPAAEAALREVREETGLDAEVAEAVDDVEYWFVHGGERIHKRVRFFLMWHIGGDVAHHDHEVEEAAMFPSDEAVARLAFASEREVVEKALAAADRAHGSQQPRADGT